MSQYTKYQTKGPLMGRCNICGVQGQLTEDHCPPKGCIRPGQIILHSIVERLSPSGLPKQGKLFQNGVKFRSICAECNNVRLGGDYDKALIEFTQKIVAMLQEPLPREPVLHVPGRPQLITRAVLGHVAAHGIDRYLKGPHTEQLREFFIDRNAPVSDWLRIYYWLFPFPHRVVTRDSMFSTLGETGEPVFFWLIKFFPIAFLMVWNQNQKVTIHCPNLDQWRAVSPDQYCDIDVPLSPVIHPMWPEAPSDKHIVMYGQEASVSMHRSHQDFKSVAPLL